jgi:hypothetical protein
MISVLAGAIPCSCARIPDRTINPDLERFMAKRMGAKTVEIEALLRRELNVAGLRRYTPEETGCMQNVYCED